MTVVHRPPRRQKTDAQKELLLELDAIFANVALGILYSRDGMIGRCNPRAAAILGYVPEELVGRAALGIFPGQADYQALARNAGPTLAAGASWSAELRLRRKDGSLVWCHVLAKAIDPLNFPSGTIWIFDDIEEDRRSRRALEAILTNASVGIMFTRDRIMQQYNPKFAEMFGFAGDAAIGQPARLLYRSDKEYAAVGRVAGPLLSQAQPFQTELFMRHRDGSDLWINLIGYVSNPEDAAQGTIWILEDRTDFKRAEEALLDSHTELEYRVATRTRDLELANARLRDFAEAASDWFWEMGPDLRFTYFSDRIRQALGVEPTALLGKSRREIMDAADIDAKWEKHLADLDGHLPFRDFEYRVVLPDGAVRDISVSGRPIFDAAGSFLGYRGIGGDVTESKRVEREIEHQSAVLRATLDNMAQGLSVVDADLRMSAMNRKFCELLDFPEAMAMQGADFSEFARYNILRGEYGPCDDVEEKVREMVALAKNPQPHRFRRRRPNGRIVEVTGNPIPGGGFVTTYTDVTVQEAAEQALRISEQRYRALTELSPDAILIMRQRRIAFANDMAARLFGIASPEQLIGRTVIDFVAPEYRDKVVARNIEIETSREENPRLPWIELQLIRGDGQRVPVESSAVRTELDEGRFVLSVVRDISDRKRAEAALRDSEEELRAIIDNAATVIFLKDAGGRYLRVNRSFEKMFGLDSQAIVGRTDFDLFPAEQAEVFARNDRKVITSGSAIEVEELVPENGSLRTFLSAKFPVRRASGEIYAVGGIATDITERIAVEQNLRVAATTFESQEGMVITDADEVILRVNKAFTEITGYSAEEAVGQTPRLFKSDRHDAAFYREMWTSIQASGTWQGEVWNRRKNGEFYPQSQSITAVRREDGAITHYVGTFTDITHRKQAEDEIRDLAFYDPLTRLPNRRLLIDRLRHALAGIERSKRSGGLMFIDLDNFKMLNDTRGHDVGDELLVEVASRLRGSVRQHDTVARLGGDEFVIMFGNLEADGMAAAHVEAVAVKVLAAINRPYLLTRKAADDAPPGFEYRCSASIGITLFSDSGQSVDEILKQADLAMYQAKAAGRNTLRFFDPEMQARVMARAALEIDLRRGVHEGQFLLHYQPQLGAGCRLTGVEALLRWQHPWRGLVSPLEFISLAEDTGLIQPLGYWVLETACKQLVAWSGQADRARLTIAVNVSALQLHHEDFVDQVSALLEQTGADPKRLKLELTESLLMVDPEAAIRKMLQLKALGVGFSLDDFGTGYSSLAYLKRLPLDQLKIDRSFINELPALQNDTVICRSIVALGQSLGFDVIAEGVETRDQLLFLRGIGCDNIQGVLISEPLPIAQLEEFIAGYTPIRI